ncbi:MAG: transposase [Flavobacteriales bacterium]|nr:transposase [Flavobacteriales bacterium]
MALRFRKHIRLPDHDYMGGAYFVTLCTRSRLQVFGRIVGTGDTARMELTDVGRIVDECWRAIPDHFTHARLDEMQIMPDHLHAILVLDRRPASGTVGATPWVAATDALYVNGSRSNGPQPGSLGAIIAAFKSETTKRANRLNVTMGLRLWQPNYYERVIREHGGEYGRIARYIEENPQNWF